MHDGGPITTLDGQRVNGGQLGPITEKIWDGHWDDTLRPYTIELKL